eukprot:COSAG01_NODE_2722_length_7183_cov_22.724026_5_plen_279_part_00
MSDMNNTLRPGGATKGLRPRSPPPALRPGVAPAPAISPTVPARDHEDGVATDPLARRVEQLRAKQEKIRRLKARALKSGASSPGREKFVAAGTAAVISTTRWPSTNPLQFLQGDGPSASVGEGVSSREEPSQPQPQLKQKTSPAVTKPEPDPEPEPVHDDSVGSDDTHAGDDVNDEVAIYEQARAQILARKSRLHIRAQILSAQDFEGHAQPTDEATIYEKARAQILSAQELQSPTLPTVATVVVGRTRRRPARPSHTARRSAKSKRSSGGDSCCPAQ